MKKYRLLLSLWIVVLIFSGCQSSTSSDSSTGDASNTVSKESVNESSNESENEVESVEVDEMVTTLEVQTSDKMDTYIESFESLLAERSLKLEDQTVKDAVSIGAIAGYGFNVNRMGLEVYLFDESSSDEKTTANIQTAKEEGYITIFGVEINGKVPTSKCTYNHGLVLIFPAEEYVGAHPNKEAIIEAFEGIQ